MDGHGALFGAFTLALLSVLSSNQLISSRQLRKGRHHFL